MGRFKVQLSSMYYNPVASFWEPFIERSKISVDLTESSAKFTCKHGLDINISDTLIDVIAMTWKSWNEKRPSLRPLRGVSRKSARVMGSTARLISEGHFDCNEEGVCPFSVKNETGMTIYLSKVSDNFVREDTESFAIHNANTLDIRVNYAETIENLQKTSNNSVKLTNTSFKISFDAGKNYPAVTNVNFNTVESNVHYLSPDKNGLDYLAYSVTQDRMAKLLTIRTPLAFVNRTMQSFKLLLYGAGGAREFIVRPEDSVSVPIEHVRSELAVVFGEGAAKSALRSIDSIMKHFHERSSVSIAALNVMHHYSWSCGLGR